MKKCDNTSVGIIARNDEGKILIIQRRKPPYGFAPPAGHLDGDTYPKACMKEFHEETGLWVVGAPRPIMLPGGRIRENKCRREGGEHHEWHIFEVDWTGTLKRNEEETLGIGWLTSDQIKILAERTERYLAEWMVDEGSWILNPGLEPIWYEFFKELEII